MDNQRLIVWAAFGLLAFMTYQAWLQDYGPAPVTEEIANQTDAPPVATNDEALPGLPATDAEVPALPAAPEDGIHDLEPQVGHHGQGELSDLVLDSDSPDRFHTLSFPGSFRAKTTKKGGPRPPSLRTPHTLLERPLGRKSSKGGNRPIPLFSRGLQPA